MAELHRVIGELGLMRGKNCQGGGDDSIAKLQTQHRVGLLCP